MTYPKSFSALRTPLGLYAVVPDANWVERVAQAGVRTVQLRYKSNEREAILYQITRSMQVAQRFGCQLFINDHWREAVELRAYGVHLGQEDLHTADLAQIQRIGLHLGISTHSHAELDCALALRPSYVACGAIFPTTTKVMATAPQGLDKLRQYVQRAGSTPTVAIGGINLNNAAEVLATGVSTIAVVRAIVEAPDLVATVRAFTALLQSTLK